MTAVEAPSYFEHLKDRCSHLISRYLEPSIIDEAKALSDGVQMPDPDFDSQAAFRLLTHAELEGYFEAKATLAVNKLDADFKSGKVATSEFMAFICNYFWMSGHAPSWGTDQFDKGKLKDYAQRSLGYFRAIISDNNGIKEASVFALSAAMGYGIDELDEVLINELNQYGKKRGDVAHDSWTRNIRTFESAEIEKSRILQILQMIKNYYEV